MDAAQEHSRRIISPTNSAVHEDQHSRLQQCRIWPYGRDASNGAGAGDERRGERVLTLAIVDLAHVGYHVRGEDADDSATRAGLRRWYRLDGGRGGRGVYDESAMGLGKGLSGHRCLDGLFGGWDGCFYAWGCGDWAFELGIENKGR